jgi:hypothetical protein
VTYAPQTKQDSLQDQKTTEEETAPQRTNGIKQKDQLICAPNEAHQDRKAADQVNCTSKYPLLPTFSSTMMAIKCTSRCTLFKRAS